MLREKNRPTSSEGNRGKIFLQCERDRRYLSAGGIYSWRPHPRWVLHCREGALRAAPNCVSMALQCCSFPGVPGELWPLSIAISHSSAMLREWVKGTVFALLQLRGISAFQGRKSAFLVFHFTACFSVWEFQKCTAEPMHSLGQHVRVAQPVDVPLPSGSHGPWGAFHQLCIHFTITQ